MRCRYTVLLICLLFVLLFVGCSSSGNDFGPAYDADGDGNGKLPEQSSGDIGVLPSSGERKIIITALYEIEIKDLDKTADLLTGKIQEAGGYIESSKLNGSTESGGSAEFVLRIPSHTYDVFDGYLKSLGNILYCTQQGEDITTKYYDTESKLNTLRIQQERILELLKKAENLQDILTLENELNRIRTEIETLTTQLKLYDNEVAYATVRVNLQQVAEYQKSDVGFWSKLGDTFQQSLSGAGYVFQQIFLALIWMLPYLAVLAVILFIIFLCRKKRKIGKRKEKESVHSAPEVKERADKS